MRIWVDCTAAAHPLVLRPIIERLRERGHEVEITAREYGQTVGILERLGLDHEVVGSHGGGATAGKGAGARPAEPGARPPGRGRAGSTSRSPTARSTSRSSAALLRIRSVQMQDYEFAGLQRQLSFRPRAGCWPRTRSASSAMRRAGAAPRKLFRYPASRRTTTSPTSSPDAAVLGQLGVEPEKVLAVVRPPPETSAYHERNPIYEAVLDRLAADGRGASPW